MNISSLLFDAPGINIFGFKIYAYALIIVCGMMTAFGVITMLFKRRNMSTDLFMTYFVICLPIAIITTRLFFCIADGMPFKDWFSFQSIRDGGLSIIGGIIGGTISVAAVSYFKKVNFLRVGDCVVVGLLLAQSIGRWGNFANQEVYGRVVENTALHFFPISVYIEATGDWHYAFCVYESVATLLGAILLFINAWRNGKKPNGVNSACYFIIYGGVRMIMEPLREAQFQLGNFSLIMAIVMFFGGILFLAGVLYFNWKKEGALFGSKTGDPYGITNFIKDSKFELAYFNSVNMMCKIHPENYITQTTGASDTEVSDTEASDADENPQEEKGEEE